MPEAGARKTRWNEKIERFFLQWDNQISWFCNDFFFRIFGNFMSTYEPGIAMFVFTQYNWVGHAPKWSTVVIWGYSLLCIFCIAIIKQQIFHF